VRQVLATTGDRQSRRFAHHEAEGGGVTNDVMCPTCGGAKETSRNGSLECVSCSRYGNERRSVGRIVGAALRRCGKCGELGHNARTCAGQFLARPVADSDRRVDHCGACGAKSDVMETRSTNGTVRRRRICPQCSSRWTTFEIDPVDLANLLKRGDDAAKLIALFRNVVKEDA
jgi:hypothetical protein